MMREVSFDTTYVPGVPGAAIQEVDRLPETLEGAVRVGGYSVARRGALLQTVPEVGQFLITDGKLVQFALEQNADPLAVEQHLAGSARATLVHQRGGLPLHAACLAPPGRTFAIAIAGHSGVGKSTLAAELVQRGWFLLGDDVTPVYNNSGSIMAWPSKGVLKLWRDACERLDIDAGGLQAIPGERDKYLLPVDTSAEPLPLSYIFQLERGTAGTVIPIEGPARLAVLRANTYKPNYLDGLQCVESHFQISCQVSEKTVMAKLNWSGNVSNGTELLATYCVDSR
jgi:hypothetical protein